MPEEPVGESAEPGREVEKIIVVFIFGSWYTKEGPSGDKLKDETTETPDIKSIVNSSGKNQFGSSETEWSNGLCWGVCKEICCSG